MSETWITYKIRHVPTGGFVPHTSCTYALRGDLQRARYRPGGDLYPRYSHHESMSDADFLTTFEKAKIFPDLKSIRRVVRLAAREKNEGWSEYEVLVSDGTSMTLDSVMTT